MSWDNPFDLENSTADDLARLFGPNWQDVVTVLQQAVSLTREEAEKIADYPLGPNWELCLNEAHEAVLHGGLVDWDDAAEACDDATDHTWSRGGPFQEASEAFAGIFIAAIGGDCIPEMTRRDLVHPWHTVFTTDRAAEK